MIALGWFAVTVIVCAAVWLYTECRREYRKQYLPHERTKKAWAEKITTR